jgi:hypothetical protein
MRGPRRKRRVNLQPRDRSAGRHARPAIKRRPAPIDRSGSMRPGRTSREQDLRAPLSYGRADR